MANYYATTRSNYFEVKNEEEFKSWCNRYNLQPISNNVRQMGFLGDGENGIAWDLYNAETDEYESINFLEELATHLANGQVAVIQEIGNEKMRYLVGQAWAVNNAGETVHINLDEIYKYAQNLGSVVTHCEY
jgi:hypothetical protein